MLFERQTPCPACFYANKMMMNFNTTCKHTRDVRSNCFHSFAPQNSLSGRQVCSTGQTTVSTWYIGRPAYLLSEVSCPTSHSQVISETVFQPISRLGTRDGTETTKIRLCWILCFKSVGFGCGFAKQSQLVPFNGYTQMSVYTKHQIGRHWDILCNITQT